MTTISSCFVAVAMASIPYSLRLMVAQFARAERCARAARGPSHRKHGRCTGETTIVVYGGLDGRVNSATDVSHVKQDHQLRGLYGHHRDCRSAGSRAPKPPQGDRKSVV